MTENIHIICTNIVHNVSVRICERVEKKRREQCTRNERAKKAAQIIANGQARRSISQCTSCIWKLLIANGDDRRENTNLLCDNDVKLLQWAKLKLSPDRRFVHFGVHWLDVLMATFSTITTISLRDNRCCLGFVVVFVFIFLFYMLGSVYFWFQIKCTATSTTIIKVLSLKQFKSIFSETHCE